MPDSTIVDIHCHTAGIGAGGSGCFVSPALRKSWRFPLYLKSFGVTEEELQQEGDGIVIRRLSETLAGSRHVSKAVILAMDGVVSENGQPDAERSELYIPNEFVSLEVRRYSNLFYGASINPFRRDALDRLDRAVAEGAVLIKWLPAIQEIDPADKRFVPFYHRLAELGIPLLSHTGEERSFTRTRDELGDPERLRLPLAEGVTVIAAHAASNGRNAGQRNHDRFIRLAASFPNLYADISGLTQVNRLGHLPRLLCHGELHERLLYGTDMPLIKTGVTSLWYHAYRLSPRALRQILRETNPWDRDVALKLALGITNEIFANSVSILGNKIIRSSCSHHPEGGTFSLQGEKGGV
jgi:predicted TIM-barrel fold metal-dependent hydrolase